MNEDDDDLFIE